MKYSIQLNKIIKSIKPLIFHFRLEELEADRAAQRAEKTRLREAKTSAEPSSKESTQCTGWDGVGGAEARAQRQLPDPPQVWGGPDLRGARQQRQGQRGAPRHAGQSD